MAIHAVLVILEINLPSLPVYYVFFMRLRAHIVGLLVPLRVSMHDTNGAQVRCLQKSVLRKRRVCVLAVAALYSPHLA